MALEQFNVCKTCFNVSRHQVKPKLVFEKDQTSDGFCPKCKFNWQDCNVARSMTDMLWYEIRARPEKSESSLCVPMQKGNTCNKGPRCLKPHNSLEKEIWESERKASAIERRELDKMFQCRVCNSRFSTKHKHDQHMRSEGHQKKAEELRLPPSVGSSLEFKSPLHKRPVLPVHVPHYKMCVHKSSNKCKSKNCQFAHSMEELRAWEEALAAERGTVQNGEDWESSNNRTETNALSERLTPKRVREHSLSSFDADFEKLEADPKNETFVDRNNRFHLLDLDEASKTEAIDKKFQRTNSGKQIHSPEDDLLYSENSLVNGQYQRPNSEKHNSNTQDQIPNGPIPTQNTEEETPNTHDEWFDDETQIPNTQNQAINRPDQRPNSRNQIHKVQDQRPNNRNQMPNGQNITRNRQDQTPEWQNQTPNRQSQSQRQDGCNRMPVNNNIVPSFMIQLKKVISTNGIRQYLSNCPSHINIFERNDTPLNLEVEEGSNQIKWIFRLASTKQDKLHAVILYDHKKIFRIGKLERGLFNQRSAQLISCPYYSFHTGCHVDREINSESYIDITLLCDPKFGTFKTYLVLQLQFSTLLAKEIRVHVGEKKFAEMANEFQEEIQQTATTLHATSPQPQDIVVWEENFKIFPFPSRNLSSNDKDSYAMSSVIELHVKKGTYENIRDVISPEVYRLRFHNLLYLEEYEHRRKLLRYTLVDYEISSATVAKTITIDDPANREPFRVSQPGWKFVTFNLKYHMFEGYRTFRPPSIAYVIPKGSSEAFECVLAHFLFDKAHFKISDLAITECEQRGGVALVRFSPDRREYEKMHASVDELNVSLLFQNFDNNSMNFRFNEELYSSLDGLDISEDQTKAVYSIADAQLRKIPTLISGPFGCGKTETLVAAAKFLVTSYPDVRILIVTKNNSCANLYIEKLNSLCHSMSLLSSNSKKKPILFRFMPTDIDVRFDNKMVTHFSKIDSHSYQLPTPEEFLECNIIVSTSIASFQLHPLRKLVQVPLLFTHIFIDESAQIIEPETCIPLVLASSETKIVFAGDIYQTRPLILSEFGRKFNLDKTLFERLYKATVVKGFQDTVCRFHLFDNFRCPELVVRFLSNIFYAGKLRPHPPEVLGPTSFPAISFVSVSGEECRAASSPSYYNMAEAEQVIRQIKLFIREGINSKQITVLSTYGAQKQLIRNYCKKELGLFIDVINLEGVQGCEYDVVIISTVRTITTLDTDLTLGEVVDLGLLDDVTQFNTILSRVRGWVMVVGSSETLSNVGSCRDVWKQYIAQCVKLNSFYEDDAGEEGCVDNDTESFEEERNAFEEPVPVPAPPAVPYPQMNPQQNYPMNPQQNHQMNPQQNHQMNPQQNHQMNPQQNHQMNPQQNHQMNPQQNHQMNLLLQNPHLLPNLILEKYNLLKFLRDKCSQEQQLYDPSSEMGMLIMRQLALLGNFEYTLRCQDHYNSQNLFY